MKPAAWDSETKGNGRANGPGSLRMVTSKWPGLWPYADPNLAAFPRPLAWARVMVSIPRVNSGAFTCFLKIHARRSSSNLRQRCLPSHHRVGYLPTYLGVTGSRARRIHGDRQPRSLAPMPSTPRISRLGSKSRLGRRRWHASHLGQSHPGDAAPRTGRRFDLVPEFGGDHLPNRAVRFFFWVAIPGWRNVPPTCWLNDSQA